MADETLVAVGADLEGGGLQDVVWDVENGPIAGSLVASPADARGRGLSLTVKRGDVACDMTGVAVYLLWRHREAREHGCEQFEVVDAAAGVFRLFWPAAIACAEGTADAQIMASWDAEALFSLAFSVRVEPVLTGGTEHPSGYSMFIDATKKLENAER